MPKCVPRRRNLDPVGARDDEVTPVREPVQRSLVDDQAPTTLNCFMVRGRLFSGGHARRPAARPSARPPGAARPAARPLHRPPAPQPMHTERARSTDDTICMDRLGDVVRGRDASRVRPGQRLPVDLLGALQQLQQGVLLLATALCLRARLADSPARSRNAPQRVWQSDTGGPDPR